MLIELIISSVGTAHLRVVRSFRDYMVQLLPKTWVPSKTLINGHSVSVWRSPVMQNLIPNSCLEPFWGFTNCWEILLRVKISFLVISATPLFLALPSAPSRAAGLGFKSSLHYSLPVWPWAGSLPSPGLRFFICKRDWGARWEGHYIASKAALSSKSMTLGAYEAYSVFHLML